MQPIPLWVGKTKGDGRAQIDQHGGRLKHRIDHYLCALCLTALEIFWAESQYVWVLVLVGSQSLRLWVWFVPVSAFPPPALWLDQHLGFLK